jgi:hypothetical protein
MNDPLSLVRRAIMAGQTIEYVDHHYVFAGHRLPEATKTCFKRTLKGNAAMCLICGLVHPSERNK